MFTTSKVRRGLRSGGFTLLEMVIALAIVFIVAAIVTPKTITFVNNYKLKSSASQLAGLIQQSRINAVRTNSVIAVLSDVVNTRQRIWIDLDGDTQYDQGEPMMMLPQTVTLQGAGFPGDATQNLGGGVFLVNVPVRFTARGIPCNLNAVNACITNGGTVGFVYYLRNIRGPGNSWAAVRVTPVGRITAVMWSGSSYQ